MSEPARNRFALDLEDLERQLRGAAQPQRASHAPDPLAELTRIVGQDDPLKDLFAHRGQPANVVQHPAPAWSPQARQEPSFAPPAYAPPSQAQSSYAPPSVAEQAFAEAGSPVPAPQANPPAELRGALDEFEALLRRTEPPRAAPTAAMPAPAQPARHDDEFHLPEPQPYQRPVPARPAAEAARDLDQDAAGHSGHPYGQQDAVEPALLDDDMPDLEPRRSRKGLWTAAALIAVGVIGVGAAMTFRGKTVSGDGSPLVISADRGPTKVEPANPGGAEIPNQNKQIYERAGGDKPAAQTKVVSSEEQPVDVQQAARSLPARVVLPGPGTAGSNSGTDAGNPLAQAPVAPDRTTTPGEQALTAVPAVPGLGEPRRVRTVSIRPDGTPAPAGSVAPLVTGSAPRTAATAPATTVPATAPQGAAASGPTTAANPPRRPAATPDVAKVQERVATPAPATTPSTPTRVAVAAPAPTPSAPVTSTIRSGSGDFAVQLGAPGSEAEARATYAALQRKYPDQLNGQAPIVRKTDLAGGKTVYRLRVGPYSRDDATTMCTALQAAGGQCFIAKN